MEHFLTYKQSIPYEEENIFKKFKELTEKEKYHVLLESGRTGRYHIIGLHPFKIVEGKNEAVSVTCNNDVQKYEGNILTILEAELKKYSCVVLPEASPFQGGAIGYFSYDCVKYIEKMPEIAEDDLKIPDMFWMFFKEFFVYDKVKQELSVYVLYKENEKEKAKEAAERLVEMWQTPVVERVFCWSDTQPFEGKSLSEEEFTAAIEKVKEYIIAGDVFQVNLSVRQAQSIHVHPLFIYEQLREINPSPYMSYMQIDDMFIVSGSPELLVKKEQNKVSARPIAGTRSRGKNEEEEEKLIKELSSNKKELAEHIMLVDLERNDLGRVCKYGTVKVDELMVIEKYSHVMHIVSNIIGEVDDSTTTIELVKAMFPGGTITGAPKIRTMEILEELEPVKRGIYTGGIGWLSFSGNMEVNIVIRTLLVKNQIGYIQAGAGVVIDSVPKYEYKESLKKAKAVFAAINQANEKGGAAK